MPTLQVPEAIRRAGSTVMVDNKAAKLARGVAAALVFYVVSQLYFHAPVDIFVYGICVGALYGLLGVALILIYRTNRIINFAAGALGAPAGIAGLLFGVLHHWPYPVNLLIAVAGSALVGGLVDFVIIRRFAQAPRLILTVATIGVSQLLAFLSIYIPIWLGSKGKLASRYFTPWQHLIKIDYHGRPLATGDHFFALFAVGAVCLGLAAFFRYTRIGIALRASAENADRASLLGIPVRRVQTVAWVIAGLLGGIAIFLRGPLVGVPLDGSLGYSVLVYALAAAVVAKMESIPTCVFAGMAIGVVIQGSTFKTGSDNLATAIMLFVILGGLLLQRKNLSRAYDTGVSTWQSVKEFRAVPAELRSTREVVVLKSLLGLAMLALAIGAPFLVGAARINKLTLIPVDAMVAISLVILSGWAGQISLGQFGLVGIGAGVAGGLAVNHNADFFVAVGAGLLVGALVSLVIGIPALRVTGFYLAITTLAFAAAVEGYVLRPDFLGKYFLPHDGKAVLRPLLFGRIDLTNNRSYYYLALVFLGAVLLAARSFRRNRSGRVLIAVRDNQRAAPAYSINLARTKLAAFAISGAIASLAGVLTAYQVHGVDYQSYGMGPSVEIFVFTVVGGLTSLPGAVAGAVIFGVLKIFGDNLFQGASTLATGVGVLFILLFLPGGLAEGFFKLRDMFLRWVANRHDILVPSLVADKRVETGEDEQDVIEHAEHVVEEVGTFDALAPQTVACPVCGVVLALEDAPLHEHFQVDGPPPDEGAEEPVGAATGGGSRRLARARTGRR